MEMSAGPFGNTASKMDLYLSYWTSKSDPSSLMLMGRLWTTLVATSKRNSQRLTSTVPGNILLSPRQLRLRVGWFGIVANENSNG